MRNSNSVWFFRCSLFLLLHWSAFSAIAQSESQVRRFAEHDLRTWASHAQVGHEYDQLKLTSKQVDQLFENRLSWMHFPGVEGRRDRAFLRGVYDVLDDSQDKRLDQILFQKWMNQGAAGAGPRGICFRSRN